MNRKQYEIDNLPTQIVIGHQTETGVTSIYFDCTSWLASWPDLVLGVWATQPGGTAAYPAATHMEGDVLVWDVTDSDTAVPGVGTVEIVGITTGKKKLSAIAKTQIMRTTTGTTTTPPEGAKAWVDNVMQAANDAETSKSQAATYAQNAAASAEKAEENAKSVTWETLSGKPSTFPPDSHTHTLESLGAASAESVNQLKDDKLDKTATAADSSKLGGQQPSYYATAESVSNISYNNAGAHNSIYRGKNLGSAVTDEQWAQIGAGTFGDLFIGDYWVINGVTWRIAAFDYWHHFGDAECTTHHAVIVPDQNLLKADGSATHWMNATDTASGAYVGSDFYTGNNGNTGKARCRSMAQSAFGSAHILTHREYLQNAVTNGYESGGAWYDSDVETMNEKMVYGCEIFSNQTSGTNIPAKFDIDNAQLPLFALDHSRICNRARWWLRDAVSGSAFASVNNIGNATYLGASDPWTEVRPAFAICA